MPSNCLQIEANPKIIVYQDRKTSKEDKMGRQMTASASYIEDCKVLKLPYLNTQTKLLEATSVTEFDQVTSLVTIVIFFPPTLDFLKSF